MFLRVSLCFTVWALLALTGCSGGEHVAPAILSGAGAVPLDAYGAASFLRTPGEPPWIYVANASYTAPSVTAYAKYADGNVAPIATIGGSNTGLVQPMGIAVDRAGKIYVSDWFASANKYDGGPSQQGVVFVYAAGSNGNVAPVATITDGLNYPYGVALDNRGNVYVGNFEGGNVTVYHSGDYKLIRTLGGSGGSYLGYVGGVAVGSTGKTYVVNTDFSGDEVSSGGGSVLVFGAHASGSNPPIQTIEGPKTGLTAPYFIAVHSSREIYVTNYADRGASEVLVFTAGATGNVKPIRVIVGSKTQLSGSGIALDGRGSIFVANSTSSITVYRGHARGNVAPIREISGGNTGLDRPSGIAVR